MSARAIYAGSFDPPTNGHKWVIDTASTMFNLVVVVARNPMKPARFGSPTADIETLAAIVPERVEVVGLPAGETVVGLARKMSATVLVRGLRSVSDLEYERGIVEVNRDLAPEIATVFLCPPPHLGHVSSSAVRSLIGLDGWPDKVAKYVPEPVMRRLK
jgi:pantetheine-phosphate adenylyltransferase